MSHFSRIKSNLVIEEALLAGLQRLNLKPVEVHTSPVKLINTWGDRDTAEVIIRREHLHLAARTCQSDLGFKWAAHAGCYTILFDSSYEFRNSILSEKFSNYQNFLAQLQAAYEIESLPIIYPEAKFSISEGVQSLDGSCSFTITQKVDPFALEVGAGY